MTARSQEASPSPQRTEAAAAAAAGEDLFNRSQYVQAREQAARALAAYATLADQQGIGRSRHLLGLIAHRMGESADAKAHFDGAISAFEASGDRRGRGMATLGLLTVWHPGAAVEIPLLEGAVSDAAGAGDKDLEGRALHSWGDRLFMAGNNEAALEKLDRAASLFDQTADKVAQGTVHNSLGRLYRRHGRLDLALNEQLKALALHQASSSPFNHLQSLNAVAVTYQSMGESGLARKYLDQALAMAERSGSPRVQDTIRANLAGTLDDQGDYAGAARMLEQVLAHGLDAFPSTRYGTLSGAYLALGRREDALAAAQKALELCADVRGTECVNALHRRARAHAAMGDTPAALADVRSAVDRLELARSRLVPADFLKQQFSEAQAATYSDAIALQFGARQGRDALETAERARARAFIDLLAANDLAAPAGDSIEPKVTPPSPADDAIVFRGASRPPAAAAPDTDATAADRRTRITAKAADASELAAVAARLNSTLLVYWVADDELFIWIVKAGGEIRAARVAVRAPALRELVQSAMPISGNGSTSTTVAREERIVTRGEMTIAVPRAPHAAWRQLHDLLIRPVRDSLPRPGTLLTIVPHGPLAQLSFAALQNERGRYLLEDYPLHYIPAVAVLQFTAAKRRSDAREGAIMLVADPRLPARSRLERPLPPLPGARTEVAAISRFVRRDRLTLLEGQAATESAIRTAASDKTVLHFATHAIVDDSQPFTSFLALRPTAATAASDGALTAREIYGIELRADLVVLSACRSGSAHVTGDGIATFARAFIYAGTPSVITSLWDVADQPTNQLLTGFYRRWFGRASKARALRAAALALLADLRAGNVRIETAAGEVTVPEHPVFWAGFVLIGEPD